MQENKVAGRVLRYLIAGKLRQLQEHKEKKWRGRIPRKKNVGKITKTPSNLFVNGRCFTVVEFIVTVE